MQSFISVLKFPLKNRFFIDALYNKSEYNLDVNILSYLAKPTEMNLLQCSVNTYHYAITSCSPSSPIPSCQCLVLPVSQSTMQPPNTIPPTKQVTPIAGAEECSGEFRAGTLSIRKHAIEAMLHICERQRNLDIKCVCVSEYCNNIYIGNVYACYATHFTQDKSSSFLIVVRTAALNTCM